MPKRWVTFSPGEKAYTDPLTLSEKLQITWAAELAMHILCSMAGISGTEKNINSASLLTLIMVIHIFPIIYFSLLINVLLSSEFIVGCDAWGIG